MRTLAAKSEPPAIRAKAPGIKNVVPLLWMTIPVFILGVVFNYLPLWGWSMAFVNYSPGVSILKSQFIGLDNFARLFEAGSSFLIAMRNTLVLSFLSMLVLPGAVLFALMIAEVRCNFFKKTVQIVTSFPNFVSWIIVYSLFFFFLSVDDGQINHLLLRVGLISEPLDYLGNPDFSWFIMTFASVWKGLGYTAIIFISAISSIDQEMYKAADVDGAGRFRKIFHITLPGIMPTFAVMMILTVGQLLNLGFEQYYTFQNPITLDKLEILDTYIYRQGLTDYDFSFATAVGIFKSLVSCVLLFMANGLFKKFMNRSII